MKRSSGIAGICVLGLFLAVLSLPGNASTDLQEGPKDAKTIQSLGRRFDIVVVPGKILQRFCNHPLEKLRLYCVQDQSWRSIPFQFDENTPDGGKVLPDEGPQANPQDSNKVLDPQDELIFMAHDAGSKSTGLQIPQDVEDSIEIAIVDPLTKGRTWCYLFYYSGKTPPLSDKRYVYWDWNAQGLDGFLSRSANYRIEGTTVTFGNHTYKQIDHDVFRTPPGAGGTDEDYLDHLKWVLEIRLMFGSIKYHMDFSKITGDLLAMRRGPVRCTSRCWAAVRLPAGVRGPKFVADVSAWEFSGASSVTRLHVPLNPGILVTNIRTRIGEDFSKNAYGMVWLNSHNSQGFMVDGLMSPMEQAQNPAQDQWRMIVGPQGAVLNRAFWSPNFIKQANYVKVSWVDDLQALDPFEFDPGQHAGYSISEVSSIHPGDYDLAIEWYFPPNIYDHRDGSVHSEIVTEFMNIMDHPLILEADGQKAESNIRPGALKANIED